MKILHPVRPNRFVEAAYRARLIAIIDQMLRSTRHWMRAAYRANEPRLAAKLAQDELPATAITARIRRLSRYWQRKFDELAPDLARYFATEVSKRSTASLHTMLKRGGISVQMRDTRAYQDVLKAAIEENVGLIRSIPQQHFGRIEGMVLRSVQTGRDLHQLTEDLEGAFGIVRRRAELIARDQNNKASAVLQRVRQAELGVTEAIWVHSGGGKHPRPTHVQAGRDKVRYNISEGWWDPAIKKFIWPGTEIQCRCVARPVIAGFS